MLGTVQNSSRQAVPAVESLWFMRDIKRQDVLGLVDYRTILSPDLKKKK